MSAFRRHLETRAASLLDCATLETSPDSLDSLRLRPHRADAVGVVLNLMGETHAVVAFDDVGSVPAELGDLHPETGLDAIDYFVDAAVEGRVTAYHLGRGGAVEVEGGAGANRSWCNAVAWPGWRRRARVVRYAPYRSI